MLSIDLWRLTQLYRRFAVNVTFCRRLIYCVTSNKLHCLFYVVLKPFSLVCFTLFVTSAMAAGNVNLQILNGTVIPHVPLAHTDVTVQRMDSNGNNLWYDVGRTDSTGRVSFELSDIGLFQPYRFRVESPSNQQSKYSQMITTAGEHQFVVGNPPLQVQLVDAVSIAPIANQMITAFRLAVDGTATWYSSHMSDADGQVIFDLDDIGQGASYQLRSQVYSQFTHMTESITEAGQMTMVMGDTRIQLLNGSDSNQSPLKDVVTTIHRLDEEGQRHYFADAVSDKDGWLWLNLPDIANGQRYQLSMVNSISEQLFYSPVLTQAGLHQFVIGHIPLRVSLIDELNQQPLTNRLVEIQQQQLDGSYLWVGEKLTSSQGELIIDLAEYGVEHSYRLSSKAFGAVSFNSRQITDLAPFDWVVGNTQLQFYDGSTQDNNGLADSNIMMYQLIDGELVWQTSGHTDSKGIIRFDLQPGQHYRFATNSPVNGKLWRSEVITKLGYHQFVVGNPEVQVRLSNILSGASYPQQMVSAYQITTDQQKLWYSNQLTDEQGVAKFDLAGIASGQAYVFSATVFADEASFSAVIDRPQQLEFGIGGVPVTLIDIDAQQPVVGKQVIAYQLLENGELNWLNEGQTNENGLVIFDFSEFYQQSSVRILFKAHDPFNQGKDYYGPIITGNGAVDFHLKQGVYGDIDVQAPLVNILSPTKSIANAQGFLLTGSYQDDVAVSSVQVTVLDVVNGENQLMASLESQSQTWSAYVPAAWLSAGQTLNVEIKATDFSLNQTQLITSYVLANDAAAPVINVTSHQAGDAVNVNGFTVSGVVSDDIEVVAFEASINDPLLGITVAQQAIDFSLETGQWDFIVTSGKVSIGQNATLSFTATDVNQTQTVVTLNLQGVTALSEPIHLAQRITFGLTPSLLIQIKSGIDYLDEQLNPQLIDDSAFEAQMASLPVETKAQLKNYVLQHMIGSQKQLREVMAWFWENHFNTNLNTHQKVGYELSDNQQFRQLALGNFRDLLAVSAKSPAMIHYLNNQQNVVGRANENYAREIMELHTMGVDGGYNAEDIAELAKIFTGWHEQAGEFDFNAAEHDYSDKEFLGHQIFGVGIDEGEQVLDILAYHPATANYLCAKLITYFVSDLPLKRLQSQCAAEYLATNGEIKSVVRVILTSDEFVDGEHQRTKVKTPLELVLATARGFATQTDAAWLDQQLSAMGMNLFEYAIPTGFAEHSADWLSTNSVLQRFNLLLTSANQHNLGLEIDFKQLLLSHRVFSAEATLAWLFELALANDFSALEYQIGLDILHQDTVFNIYGNDASDKLNRLLGTVLSFPNYHYQ